MPKFKYKARDQAGTLVVGYAEADNLALLKNGLKERGLWVTEAKAQKEFWSSQLSPVNQTIKQIELIMFSKQMAVMLGAGVSLVNSLLHLEERASSRLKPVIQNIVEGIKSGKTYAETLADYPRIFSPFYVGMIELGEAGGLLAEMHRKVASHLQQNQDLKKKLLFASIYPGIVIATTIIGIAIILVQAFPKIADIYRKNKVELPLITQVMMKLSNLLIKFWYVPLAMIVLLLILTVGLQIQRRQPLKGWLDSLVLKIPFYGEFYQKITFAKFTHNTALLLNSGVPLLKALAIVKTLLDNTIVQNYVNQLMASVREGFGMTVYLKQNKFFPSLLVSLISTGEESGELVRMMNEASAFYEVEVEEGVKKFIAVIEPVLLIIAAGSVFIVLLAFYLPLFKMFQVMNR
ncbi:MAG TPA: type II secretion system F family protein [Bacillota bacterium]|jgi:type II secretory pathway component PulF|nr:type II secretion system F family protein [Bacillota bacterium]HOL11191.1 type II secretion system F family protein [Bacillota bacterium]HPO98897.1 type II secretion system F family protein [Bacillota bacterium]